MKTKLLPFQKHCSQIQLVNRQFLSIVHTRHQSTSSANVTSYPRSQTKAQQPQSLPKQAPMAVLPTKSLLRSLLFTSVMSSPLLDPCLWLMKVVVNSKSALFNPSRNPPLNYLLRSTIYEHFCAGTDDVEVRKTVRDMKNLGFKGVILGYARDVVLDHEESGQASSESSKNAAYARMVEEWKEGNLRTLSMIGPGDFLAVK